MPIRILQGKAVIGYLVTSLFLWPAGEIDCLGALASYHGEAQIEIDQQEDPCSNRQNTVTSELFEKFALPEPSGDPWGEYASVMLSGRFREIIECADMVELLVPYEPDNTEHIKKRKAGKTVREDLVLFGEQAEYFKYILPTTQLKGKLKEEATALLLGPTAYLEFGSGPKFSGVIHGSRYVFRFSCGEVKSIISVSKGNLPSIWFSGGGLQPFGGLLHPDVESRWHKIVEEAEKN